MTTLTEAAGLINRQELARETVRLIEANREQHDQGGWLAVGRNPNGEPGGRFVWDPTEARQVLTTNPEDWQCGTTACAAGWILVAALAQFPDLELPTHENNPESVNYQSAAATLLDLDEHEAGYLFLRADNHQAVARLTIIGQGRYYS